VAFLRPLINVAVCLSGSGRTLQNLIDLQDKKKLPIRIVLVISSNAGAYGVERAKKHGILVKIVKRHQYTFTTAFTEAILDACETANADLICLAGFVKQLAPISKKWINCILNIHPSLLPAFGGKGFYGNRIHKAVLERGVKVTGCTVHYVDDKYDNGPILIQKSVLVENDDTHELLAERVFKSEKLAYPEAIQKWYYSNRPFSLEEFLGANNYSTHLIADNSFVAIGGRWAFRALPCSGTLDVAARKGFDRWANSTFKTYAFPYTWEDWDLIEASLRE